MLQQLYLFEQTPSHDNEFGISLALLADVEANVRNMFYL